MKKIYDGNVQQTKAALGEFCTDFFENRDIACLKSPHCEIYIRVRELHNVRELTLATIDIDEPLLGRGFLAEILDFIETELNHTPSRSEPILSPRLAIFF